MTKPEESQELKNTTVMFFSHTQAATEREGGVPQWQGNKIESAHGSGREISITC